jgi:hypothetical protein
LNAAKENGQGHSTETKLRRWNRVETTIITFEITSSFADWSKAYDESLPLQKEFGLQSLFRGNDRDMPTRCVVIVAAEPGQLDKFMEANAEMVAASGHVLESTVLTTYVS